MEKVLAFHAIDTKGETVIDPQRLAATRCLSLLYLCATNAPVIQQNVKGDHAAATHAMAEILLALLERAATLPSDLKTMSAMLGCQVIEVNAKGDA